jgi:hypothetical protein
VEVIAVANTHIYFDKAIVTALKSLIALALVGEVRISAVF